jgi:hypothetical protein
MATDNAPLEALPDKKTAKPLPLSICIAAALIAASTILLHIHSYWWSESLTLCDVTVRTDEGLVSLLLPLTRIAANESPTSGFLLYKRGPKVWTAGLAGHTPLRNWMTSLDSAGAHGGMFADFGFWKGAWQSDSRPGPFIVLFIPVWFVGTTLFGIYLAFHFQLIRFRLRTLLIATTLAAFALFLLTLRA